MVYTPGHRGIAPNAVADAIAKAYLGAEGDGGVLGEVIQQTVHVRPYVWGKGDEHGGWEGPDDRRVNVQVREGIMEWMRVVHGGGGQDGKTMAGADKEGTWMQVMQAVTTGSDVEVRRFQREHKRG